MTLRDGQVHEAVTNTPSGQETRHYRIVSSPLRDHAGRVAAAIEMVEDITEQRKMQARLIQSEKMVAVGQLSAGIAHEIKNPLSIISLALESLQEDLGDDRPGPAGPDGDDWGCHRAGESGDRRVVEFLPGIDGRPDPGPPGRGDYRRVDLG